MDEMLRKLKYDFVLSKSKVPSIYKKIHQTRDTKIQYLSWYLLQPKPSKKIIFPTGVEDAQFWFVTSYISFRKHKN